MMSFDSADWWLVLLTFWPHSHSVIQSLTESVTDSLYIIDSQSQWVTITLSCTCNVANWATATNSSPESFHIYQLITCTVLYCTVVSVACCRAYLSHRCDGASVCVCLSVCLCTCVWWCWLWLAWLLSYCAIYSLNRPLNRCSKSTTEFHYCSGS